MKFHSIEAAVADLRQGKMIILVDSKDRENEGDLVMAAEKITPDAINFMATHGRGLICLSLTAARLAELQIPQMVSGLDNGTSFGTAFTVSIEARRGVTTGISAADRATTICTAVNPKTKPEDLVRPGHVFPLQARAGGVLERAGHTEGSVDLARLAGLAPAGVLCEILNNDGTMARVPQLMAFARRFDLNVITIQELIRYRSQLESVVRVVAETCLPLPFGEFRALVLEHEITKAQYVALIRGAILPAYPTPVYIHSSCVLGDVFGSLLCDCSEQLKRAMRMMTECGAGIIIYLSDEGGSCGPSAPMRAGSPFGAVGEPVQTNRERPSLTTPHICSVSAQILTSLGVKQVRLLTNTPLQLSELTGCGLDVVECLPIPIQAGAGTRSATIA